MEVGQRVGDEEKPGPKCRKAAPEDGLSFTDCKLGSGLDPNISFGLPNELPVAWLAAEGFCHAVGILFEAGLQKHFARTPDGLSCPISVEQDFEEGPLLVAAELQLLATP